MPDPYGNGNGWVGRFDRQYRVDVVGHHDGGIHGHGRKMTGDFLQTPVRETTSLGMDHLAIHDGTENWFPTLHANRDEIGALRRIIPGWQPNTIPALT